ncbi:hypothetical protein E2C01_093396 [Portunus trituberculatus]|uniref:Uncharacterized protein n=1 Tax=Portunus trituberculatus TaxID=210409 RepID=A0A5B7JUN8_PORTR|nr:hypothetical protein [Portunus trituberculatus]
MFINTKNFLLLASSVSRRSPSFSRPVVPFFLVHFSYMTLIRSPSITHDYSGCLHSYTNYVHMIKHCTNICSVSGSFSTMMLSHIHSGYYLMILYSFINSYGGIVKTGLWPLIF